MKKIYEKPEASWIEFEMEAIMDEFDAVGNEDADIGDLSVAIAADESVEDWD